MCWVRVFGFAVMLACAVVFLEMFFKAFLHGLFTGDYSSVLLINVFGEARIEAIMLLFGIPCMVYFVWWSNIWQSK